MDKLRFNKDARYYRTLLYKNEFRQSKLSSEIKHLKSFHQLQLSSLHSKYETLQKSLYFFKYVLYLQFIIQVYFIYNLKDLDMSILNHDYSSTLLYMWQSYREQIRKIFESYSEWTVRM